MKRFVEGETARRLRCCPQGSTTILPRTTRYAWSMFLSTNLI
jgi:hypothetical protein